jgi:hypothetical protein
MRGQQRVNSRHALGAFGLSRRSCVWIACRSLTLSALLVFALLLQFLRGPSRSRRSNLHGSFGDEVARERPPRQGSGVCERVANRHPARRVLRLARELIEDRLRVLWALADDQRQEWLLLRQHKAWKLQHPLLHLCPASGPHGDFRDDFRSKRLWLVFFCSNPLYMTDARMRQPWLARSFIPGWRIGASLFGVLVQRCLA